MSKSIALILLAAGSSSRLGKPKQLLEYDGKSLLRQQVQVAVESKANTTVVVLGSNASTLKKEIEDRRVHIVLNEQYKEGIASSIKSGLGTVLDIAPSADAVIIMVCDQPFVTPSVINDLITTHRGSGKPIVTCSYKDTFGPPTLFHKTLFPDLLQLTGDIGARRVIQEHVDEAALVIFPEGNIDIDTEADYERLLRGDANQ